LPTPTLSFAAILSINHKIDYISPLRNERNPFGYIENQEGLMGYDLFLIRKSNLSRSILCRSISILIALRRSGVVDNFRDMALTVLNLMLIVEGFNL
jgi:hypothetical protein